MDNNNQERTKQMYNIAYEPSLVIMTMFKETIFSHHDTWDSTFDKLIIRTS